MSLSALPRLPLLASAAAAERAQKPRRASGTALRASTPRTRSPTRAATRPRFGACRSLLSADHDVLEIGCGTGSTALRLAPYTRRLLATDVSPNMIAIAREKLAAEPVPELSFAVADADAPAAGRASSTRCWPSTCCTW